MLNRNFAFLVATILAIENCWLCAQGLIFRQLKEEVSSETEHTRIFFNVGNKTYAKPFDLGNEYFTHNEVEDLKSYAERLVELMDSKLNRYVNASEHSGELCNRECKLGDNRICYFKFTLEFYQAMGIACGRCSQGVEKDCNHPQCIVGDGVEKGVMSINRQIPGPSINVCQDDWIVVDVHNTAEGTAAGIHWHGIHQVETPFMDGVPFVTQCPIQFSGTFRYQFKATQPGTQFYHSHSGHHKANGQYGALNVRQPKEIEPLSVLYDYDLPEHNVFIVDWMHTYAEHLYPGLPSTVLGPDSVLINGRGMYINPETFERTKVRPTVYYVIQGKSYRFRLVNSVSHFCPFQMQIDQHNMTIIATDSFTVMPRTFDTLISNAGERYDFILYANKKVGDYWMRVIGMGSCANKPIESYALIRYIDRRYKNDPHFVDKVKNFPVPPIPVHSINFPTYATLNHPNATCWNGKSSQCITELTAFEEDDHLRYSEPDYKFFLGFDNYIVSNKEIFKKDRYVHFENPSGNLTLVAAINQISLTFPSFPPLTQPELVDESMFCDGDERPPNCNGTEICHCIHRLKVARDSVVELIIVDETDVIGNINHPFHLHGYGFMVIGIGNHPLGLPMTTKRAIEMEKKHLLIRDVLNTSPPLKDTVSIPGKGYAILRFKATNPGFWLMHCHYEWHLSVGMGLILQVGELSEMVRAPKDFPKCGNYLPPINKPVFHQAFENLSHRI